MLTIEAFMNQNNSVRDMINKALRHCMMRPPGRRVVYTSEPYLDPTMLFAHAEIKREFAPTLFSTGSSDKLPGDSWKRNMDRIRDTTKFLLQQAVFKKTDMDHEGYVAMDTMVTGLKIKWSALTESDKRLILEPEMGLLIAATMTDRQEGLTTWHPCDPESINHLLEDMAKTTLYNAKIATNALTDYDSQC